jgi:vanillate O-demethylase ferredoxin subunit
VSDTGVVVRVAEIVSETPSIRTLRLVHEDGRPFGPFAAGAHIDVTGPTGVLRQYSLASDPNDPSSIVIAIKRESQSRGGSAALHEVQVGDRLKIGKPRNLLAIADEADRHLLVAGGIGVTPLLAMAYDLYQRGAEFDLVYVVRSREEAAFLDLLENRVEFADRIHLVAGVPRQAQLEVLAEHARCLTPESHVYTCGPDGFMAQVTAAFSAVVGDDHIHVEHFIADDVDSADDTSFTVELDTGEAFEIPVGRSILSVLEENGIEVFKSCEEGICGSCVSGVVDGIPDHRDHCLSASVKASNKEIALCVSRALTDRLVIELY